ncbi:Plasma-membrane choline transporter [Aspergillus parasiticus SU-1]|uniref:Protein PNS1 n=1 Tax=Aspergillus parasiticus (strain ATCC 56775 / NRRL 5862 / SRRC 143 / SU-1) TaxID=1403190 RepID=A0A0F0IKZ5_ASPPU|nr:Plasma-membrane choline transporter [Aspergillus parasiticus SU-1]
MFSEYASRFLAQSQSRLLPHSDETRKKGHGRLMQQPGSSRFPSSRSFLQRATLDPYQPTASQISNLPLGSRNLAQHAPLFYSATDDFCEEDDEAEHEREIADFYALQKSRRNFGSSHLKASSEIDEDDDHSNSVGDYGTSRYGRYGKAQGIRSSWRAGTSYHGEREVTAETVLEAAEVEDGLPMDEYNVRARENLVDVHLEDSLRSRADSSETGDDNPPSVQRFRGESQSRKGNFGIGSFFMPMGADRQPSINDPRPLSPTDPVQASFAPDKVMRWGSIAPFIIASVWIYNVIRGRHAIGKAIRILEFACRILATNPELLILGLGILAFIVSWTWLWILMFTRVFLGGTIAGPGRFTISFSSWWLGVYFILVYVWSLGVIAGLQRAVTAATVSQWYFHRLTSPAPTSRQIVWAAFSHSLTALFGTICLSRLCALLVRLPLLLLPSRATSVLSLFAYSVVPTPVTTITDPLALTYASIHSQPLVVSARSLARMTTLSPTMINSSLHPRSYSRSHESMTPLIPYRLSKLILHAARLMMSLALGFGGWVTTARDLGVSSGSGVIRGSVYAYVVGLIAGTIGWSVLGAIERVIADIVDASVICWSSEVGAYGREARYCREAGWLFGEGPSLDSSFARHREAP